MKKNKKCLLTIYNVDKNRARTEGFMDEDTMNFWIKHLSESGYKLVKKMKVYKDLFMVVIKNEKKK